MTYLSPSYCRWVSDSVGLYALTLLLVFGFGVLQEALAASNAHYSVRFTLDSASVIPSFRSQASNITCVFT